MAKLKKSKSVSLAASASSRSADAARQARLAAAKRVVRRVVLNLAGALALLIVLAFVFAGTKGYVEKKLVFPSKPPVVVLKHRPDWMSDLLAEQITQAGRPAGTHSALDHQMLVDVSDMLTHDERIAPWIKQLRRVRRVFGTQPGDTLEVDCDYRAPAALVHWGDYYWLVDADGIKLPQPYEPAQIRQIMFRRDGRMNLRVIEGVVRPPPESGRKWIGDDLAAGIELLQYIAEKPFTEEISAVSVANFAGRAEARAAQLVLITRDNTLVQWGRPVKAHDYWVEVPPQTKLDYLQRIVEKYHRVDGNHSAVDIRFDRVTFPAEDPRTAGHRVEADGRW